MSCSQLCDDDGAYERADADEASCRSCADGVVERVRECAQCREEIRVCEDCAFEQVHQVEDPTQAVSHGIFDIHFVEEICDECHFENSQCR